MSCCLLTLSFFTFLECFLCSLLADALGSCQFREGCCLCYRLFLLRCSIKEARGVSGVLGNLVIHLRAESASSLNELIQAISSNILPRAGLMLGVLLLTSEYLPLCIVLKWAQFAT